MNAHPVVSMANDVSNGIRHEMYQDYLRQALCTSRNIVLMYHNKFPYANTHLHINIYTQKTNTSTYLSARTYTSPSFHTDHTLKYSLTFLRKNVRCKTISARFFHIIRNYFKPNSTAYVGV